MHKDVSVCYNELSFPRSSSNVSGSTSENENEEWRRSALFYCTYCTPRHFPTTTGLLDIVLHSQALIAYVPAPVRLS